MKRICKAFLPACCLLLFCQLSNAQIYPVQVTPQIIPPYSFKLSDYATTTREKLFVNLLLTDARESGRQVRLKMYVEGPGIKFQTVDFVSGMLPIILDGGVNQRLTNLDLQPYFDLNNLVGITPQQYARQLPEGQYRFCFEVYDQFSGQRISNRSCANIFLVLNDPPLLNVPFRGDLVTARDPQNLVFNWTPRHFNAGAVQYEFTLKELWDTGMDPQAAFMASPPLYRTTTFANTLHYGPAQMPLLEGKTYGWQVRAFVGDGITETSLFRNNGLSEVYHFAYRADCHPPHFVLSEAQNSQTVKITWQMGEQLRYRVQYRKKGHGEGDWFGLWSQGNEATIRNLEAGTVYEFRVGGDCTGPLSVSLGGREESGEGLAFSPIHEFTTPTEDEMAYYNCGIPPEIEIKNQEPLQNLGVNEVFTAGDFTVTVVEAQGSNGKFSGRGFITVPYLADTKIAVGFVNIALNTDYQLIDGLVETEYNPSWGNVGSVDEFISDIGELFHALFSQKEELLAQLSEAESFEEQQGIISQINDLEVTIGQQIDQIPNKENLPQELQDELESLKQEGDIVANSTLTPQEIESISTADAKRRERIREIAAIAENYSSSGSFDFEIAQSIEGIYKEEKLPSSVVPNTTSQSVFDYEGIFSTQFEAFLSNLLIAGKYKVKIYTYNSQSEILAAINSMLPESDEVIILMQKNTSKVLVKMILGKDVSNDLLNKNITKEELVNIIRESTPSSLKTSILFDEIKRNMAGYALVAEAEAYDGNVAALIAIKLLDWGVQGIESFELPSRYYDPSANGYSPLLGGDAVHNAFVCGLYNGLIQEAQALPELASLLIKISASEENQAKLKAEIDQILDTGILQTMVEGLVNNYNLNDNGTEMVAYQFGKDVVALATMFVSFGELTKAGKVTNITRVAEPLQDAFGVFKLSARIGANTTRTGSEMVLHLGDDLGNVLAKVDANGVYTELKWLDEGTVLETLTETKYIDNFGEEVFGELTVLRKGDEVGFGKIGNIGKIGDNLINSVSGDIRKFSEYALTNPSKTGLFVDSWGYKLSDAETLLEIYKNQALRALTDGELINNGIDDFGNQLYKIETILDTPLKGEIKVYAGWIIKPNAIDELILSTPFDGFVK